MDLAVGCVLRMMPCAARYAVATAVTVVVCGVPAASAALAAVAGYLANVVPFAAHERYPSGDPDHVVWLRTTLGNLVICLPRDAQHGMWACAIQLPQGT
jgi:hypothetical protein